MKLKLETQIVWLEYQTNLFKHTTVLQAIHMTEEKLKELILNSWLEPIPTCRYDKSPDPN